MKLLPIPNEILDLIHDKTENRPSPKDQNFNYVHQEDVLFIAKLAFTMGKESTIKEAVFLLTYIYNNIYLI
jgi:hypothetical protein